MRSAPDIEATTLLAVLDNQRQHIRAIVHDLADADLRRPALPSGWTSLGLVNHLALDVELFWFRAVLAGEPAAIDELDTIADAWQVAPGTPAQDILDVYDNQIALANDVIRSTPADAEPKWWPDRFGGWRLASHREILLHVITETACHAGHLDAARELMDGRQWLVLT
ncbi:MAG TPA: DinB family protein [Micromonosporaceae bacterium]|jgi:uncharacterized damage-inducible protein DinB|nr:DinB family protein [Micromonosporaceae bacterium]